jgi:hypothetical protein
LNGDHHADLIYVGENVQGCMTSITVLLGTGSGGFQVNTPTCVWSSVQPDGAAVADFDGDGNLDVATWGANYLSDPGVSVAYGDGAGNFVALIANSLNNSLALDAFVAGDFNSDGKADLAGFLVDQANPNYQADVVVLLSKGRTFAAPQRLRTSPGAQFATSGLADQSNYKISNGDFNGDGVMDALVISPDLTGSWTIQALLMNVLE